jgi:hypothetical protein
MFRLVDATDLNSWANRRDAQEKLPQLLRRLVHATTDSQMRISFPAGESVQSGGYDGIIEISEENAFVPIGLSIWELGVNRDTKGKADDDYSKRSENSLGIEKTKATFVFVTPRKWGNKDEWVRLKKEENVWLDVRAYDADDIEQWLEIAPAVNVWLGHHIGKRPEDSQDLETFWGEWMNATNPPFPVELLLSNRSQAKERLHNWMNSSETGISVQTDSIDESVAFLAAYLYTLPEEERVVQFSKSVIVYNANVFRTLIANNDRLILIPMFNEPKSIGAAIQKGHLVYVPISKDITTTSDSLVLPSFSRRTLERTLIEVGVSEDKSRELAIKSKGSLAILRRILAIIPEVHSPTWAKSEEARALIPFILAGRWDNNNLEDRKIISSLARKPYDEVLDTFTRWANTSDAPLKKVGSLYQVVSRFDSWQQLSKYIDMDDISILRDVVLGALGNSDPSYDLPKEERFMAGINGKVLPNSDSLRFGLSETLALLSAQTDKSSNLNEPSRGIVWNLLSREGMNWKFWASLDDALPNLAEAEPDAFLISLESSIINENFGMSEIFKQETSMGGCAQSDLLWALETCAWNPQYLGMVSLLLAKLDAIDPGGNYSNRPFRSLKDIFLCWHPQTTASLSRRFEVIDSLLKFEPDVGWNLICKLLPSNGGSTSGTRRPKWRDWSNGFENGVANGEYADSIGMVLERLVLHIERSEFRWIDIIGKLNIIPTGFRESLIQKLSLLDPSKMQREAVDKIWEVLRKEVSRNRKYSDANWALSAETTEILYSIYMRFQPTDIFSQYSWIFSWHPDHPDCVYRDWRKNEEALREIQLKAIEAILSQYEVNILVEIGIIVERPFVLGTIAGKNSVVQSNINQLLSTLLGKYETSKSQFASGLVMSLFEDRGWIWVKEILSSLGDIWSVEQKAEFFRYLPFNNDVWVFISDNIPIIKDYYWNGLDTFSMRPLEHEYEIALDYLLEYKRSCSAFYILSLLDLSTIKPSIDKIVIILNDIIKLDFSSQDWISIKNSFDYNLGNLLDYLSSMGIDKGILESLEWMYLPFFTHGIRTPRSLLNKLSKEPEFFTEVIATIYNSEKDEEDFDNQEELVVDEIVKARAGLAYDLLNSWEAVPGISADGILDSEFMNQWIDQVRELCTNVGRGKIADMEIGKLLAYAPLDADGFWPHIGVRDLIEKLQSSVIEDSINIAIYNKRGIVSKAIDEGGAQERDLAIQYNKYAEGLEGKWIRTAAIVRRVAESYMSEARSEDIRAELD